jgi:hypothetical protein
VRPIFNIKKLHPKFQLTSDNSFLQAFIPLPVISILLVELPMPPPRCFHTVPLRAIDSAGRPPRSSRYLSATCSHSFSTSSQHQYATPGAAGPSKGVTTLRLKKKGRPEKTAKPPEPGERRALRKRIVLSNTNALAVSSAEALKTELVVRGPPKIYTLPVEVIDQLRAVEAFKPKQGWAFFQTPAVLMRYEARVLRAVMDGISTESSETEAKHTSRKVICGEKGAGKSVLLLQAMALAFQRGWIVVNLPEGMSPAPACGNICANVKKDVTLPMDILASLQYQEAIPSGTHNRLTQPNFSSRYSPPMRVSCQNSALPRSPNYPFRCETIYPWHR